MPNCNPQQKVQVDKYFINLSHKNILVQLQYYNSVLPFKLNLQINILYFKFIETYEHISLFIPKKTDTELDEKCNVQ